MEIKVNAVVLRTTEYGENDKILTLLTAENGKITAGIKGVKKAGAKLKFAAQPFCFAEYILAAKGDKYTVINASETESFYDLRTDINKFYAASAALEVADALSYEGDGCPELFYALVKALSDICAGDESAHLIKFLCEALEKSGYAVALDRCLKCGKPLSEEEKLRFDFAAGAFTCYNCGDGSGVSRTTYNVLRKIAGKPYIQDFITADGEKRALRLLREYFFYKLNVNFKSLPEYIRLL